MTFSIEQVRQTFTADVNRLVGEILDAADAVLGTPSAMPADIGGRPAFEAMGEAGHALLGTTRLVGVTSLSESARVLEQASRAGQEALRQLVAQAARVRALAGVASEGAQQMKEMLELELAKRGEEALQLSMAWQARAAAVLEDRETALGTEPPPAPESVAQEFEFDDAAPAPEPELFPEGPRDTGEDAPREEFAFGESVVDAGPLGFEDELLGVFREEVRGTLAGLADRLAELRRDPADLVNLSALERHYHTMKGAAATVRLREVSEAAARLDDQLSEMLEAGVGPTPSVVDALVADTNTMLALARLPALDLPAPATPGAATAEARRLFFEEGRDLLAEARGLARTLSAAAGPDQARVRADLERLFHRWKGSALIVGEREMSLVAEATQHRLEAMGDADTLGREVVEALGRLEALLGAGSPSVMAGSIDEGSPRREAAREPVSIDTKGELWEAFQVEANELLEAIEGELLILEDSQQPKTALETVLRQVHTLKGVVNTVGLSPTGKLLHAVEDFLETLVAAPILPPLRKVTTLLLEVRDGVRRNFRQAREGQVEALLPVIEARIARLLGGRAPTASVLASAREEGASIHSLESARSRRSLRHGTGPGGSPDGTERKFVRVATERLDSLMNLAGELVVSRSRLLARASSLRDIQQELGRGSRRLLESVEAFRDEHEFANLDGRRVRREVAVKAAQQRAAAGSTQAWSGFGELELDHYDDIHILSRTLAEITSDFTEMNGLLARGLASLADDSDSFDKLVSGIQGEVTRARMVPLEVLFTRLRFPVRDAADRDAKDVRVTTVGADVALDKTIADALLQPMLHLVRNSVVHGIESPAQRERAGKPRAGSITLTARQQAGQIGIEVRDDGAGLDLTALRQRGVAMGLISPDVALDDPAVRELVFQPGLTTRAQAGAVSGRGVGCDVVRRAVQRLGGSIRVESESGRGTTFLITLPVSLAITKALLVRARGRLYAVPLHFAERIVDRAESAFVESAGVRRIRVGDELLTVSTFEQHFGEKRPSGPGRAVLLLRVGDHRHALEVDAVAGQEEIVVKALGPFLAGHPLFAGVTVRGSGDLVLILDVAGLIARAQRGTRPRPAERPARAGQPERAPTPAPAAPAPSSSAAPAIRALFIDDSLSVRKFAEITLKGLGVDVTLAIDGVDGLDKLRGGTFDVVFTDLEMPRMHGFELIGELRFLPAYKDLPVIVVTSRSGQKHQQQARAVGATDYLTKPFSAQMLEAALKRWVRRHADGPGNKAGKAP